MRFHFIVIIFILSMICFRCTKMGSNPSTLPEINQNEMILTDASSPFNLSVTLLYNLLFLEHVYSWKNQSASSVVIATRAGSGDIYMSYDLGSHFYQVYESERERWKGCLTTASGRHLLWDEKSSKIWMFDENWNLDKQIRTGNYGWLGNWGIAEYDQTIMYAEYAGDVDTLYVWRSQDDGDHWQKVFSQRGRCAEMVDIRHFHTVQPDPYNPHHWYVSSGDGPEESKIWKSSDNGSHWTNVTDPDPEGTHLKKVHRFTAIYFDESFLYWGTDDEMDGSAKFVRAKRAEPLQVEVINNLDNLVMSLISTPYGLLFISERKVTVAGKLLDFTILLSPDQVNVQELYRISDHNSLKTGFCYARSSIASNGDIFFSYFDGSLLFNKQQGMLKWNISKK